MRSNYHVFISHTGFDDVKDIIARPTRWFLKRVLQIDVFLDDEDIRCFQDITSQLAAHAYECTHALVILSPSFQSRKFCVKELNTFMSRLRQDDGIRILPVLWNVRNLDAYHPKVQNLAWIENTSGCSAADFMVEKLWPSLLAELSSLTLTEDQLASHLCQYIEAMRAKRDIPGVLESFHVTQQRKLKSKKRSKIILCFVFAVILIATLDVVAVASLGAIAKHPAASRISGGGGDPHFQACAFLSK